MPKTVPPGTLFLMLKKAKGLYQKVRPNLKSPAEVRHKRIANALKKLQLCARKKKAGMNQLASFTALRRQLLKDMKAQLLLLKKDKDEDPNEPRLKPYLKRFTGMTLAIKRLTYDGLDDSEEETPDADELEEGDTDALLAEEDEAGGDDVVDELEDEDLEEEEDESPADEEPLNEAELAAAWKERSVALAISLKQLRDAGAPEAAEVAQILSTALGQARGGDYAGAHATANKADPVIAEALVAARRDEAEEVVPEGKVTFEAVRVRWQQIKVQSFKGLVQLVGALKADGDEDALKIAGIVGRLATDFPAQLDSALARLGKAVEAGDRAAVVAGKKEATQHLRACLAYMSANEFYVARCEDNPYDVPVAIRKPLTASLKEIAARLAAL
jgi:hypothetical protein